MGEGEPRTFDNGELKDLRQKPRVLDFVTRDGLFRLTGCTFKRLVTFIVKELVDNALDKEGVKNILVGILRLENMMLVYVADDGDGMFTAESLRKILDFANAPSSKRGIKGIKRGVLGNALQCCFGISYALWDDEHRPDYTAEILGEEYWKVRLLVEDNFVKPLIKPENRMVLEKCIKGLDPKVMIDMQNSRIATHKATLIILKLPLHNYDSPFEVIRQIARLNPHVSIHYREGEEFHSFEAKNLDVPSIAVEGFGDIWWYTYEDFKGLAKEFQKMRVPKFVMMFRRFRDPRYAKELLNSVQLRPDLSVSELTEEKVKMLFQAMHERTKPISARNLPVVGEKIFRLLGATEYAVRYKTITDGDRVVPFAIEAAAFPCRDGRKEVFESINFTASLYRPFSKWVWAMDGGKIDIFDIVRKSEANVEILLHLVCPNLTWLSPSKGEMAELDIIEKALFAALKSVCKKEMGVQNIKDTIIFNVKEIMNAYPFMEFTVRQIFYRLVVVYKYQNTKRAYKILVKILTEARDENLIDAERIVDYSRPEYFNNPPYQTADDYEREWVRLLLEEFDLDRWGNQPVYVEVWIEKEALSRVILPICKKYRVNLIVKRGYSSYTQVYRASKRFPQGKPAIILYLGDHDPPGLHIEEKLRERLVKNLSRMGKSIKLKVKRVALTYLQVKIYDLPHSPLKRAGQKRKEYYRIFGDKVWELDALPPQILCQLLEEEIKRLIDWHVWEQREQEIEEAKKKVKEKFAKVFPEYVV